MNTKGIVLAELTISPEIQPRCALNKDVLQEYSEALANGEKFPPLVAFFDGKKFWLADGFHRIEVYKQAKIKESSCEIRQGSKRDAILYACSANVRHGLRLSNADKRKIVTRLLKDEEWKQWSARKLAEVSGTSDAFVRKLMEETGEKPVERKVERAGKEYAMDTGKIGRNKKEKEEEPRPPQEPAPSSYTASQEEQEEEEAEDKGKADPPADYDTSLKRYRVLVCLGICLEESKKGGFLPDVGREAADILMGDLKAGVLKRCSTALNPRDLASLNVSIDHFAEWLEEGRKTPEKKAKASVPDEALRLAELWKKLIGLPQTEKPIEEYAAALAEIHDIDKQEWHVIEEAIYGAKICWVDQGISILSPIGLRSKIRSGACKKWEAIIDQYRKHKDYKPLSKPPKCPTCGKILAIHTFSLKGRQYSGYMCKAHPEESLPLGRKFMPHKPIVK